MKSFLLVSLNVVGRLKTFYCRRLSTKFKFFGLNISFLAQYAHPEKDIYTYDATSQPAHTHALFCMVGVYNVFYFVVVQKGCVFLKSHFLKEDD